MSQPWAHSANVEGQRHSLRAHLLGTAALAADFAEAFGAAEAGATLGICHDAGKISAEWQEYLLQAERESAAGRKMPGSVDHKSAGAVLAGCRLQVPGSIAVFGHHDRLPNKDDAPALSRDVDSVREALMEAVPEVASHLSGPVQIPKAWIASGTARDIGALEFGTRMLHSALVDADFLDTSAHFAAVPVSTRSETNFRALAEQFETARAEVLAGRSPSPTDTSRQRVYEAAVAAAAGVPGIYRLPAPTGSGKTFSAAAFALHHAAHHGHRRVVVAVPFLTVTEQNAAVYRHLLGDHVVLEHHSAIEPEGMQRYGVENWDAPFVVTTTVQLFESLFSGKPAKSRKLHRLARSVIVLDEVQAIPPHALTTVLDGLRILVQYFGVTVLLASATQPPFEVLEPFKRHGVEARSVIPDPRGLYRAMRRVTTSWVEVPTPASIVEEVRRERQSLLIVNTTAQARDLARDLREQVPHEVLHLSTRMCQAHRRAVLARAGGLLAADAPVTLVSTQLIEAGVDVDFPVVFRSLAPAESLLQAAGRANREGHRATGKLVVLHGDGVETLRAYATSASVTVDHFHRGGGVLDDPRDLDAYYRDLYEAAGPDRLPLARELKSLRDSFQFRTVGERFRMIDDDSTTVLVRYDAVAAVHLAALAAAARDGQPPTRATLRALQPYAVSLPRTVASAPEQAVYLTQVVPGVHMWSGPYDELVGIDTGAGPQDTVW